VRLGVISSILPLNVNKGYCEDTIIKKKNIYVILILVICIIIVYRISFNDITYIKYNKIQNYIENEAGNQIYIEDYFWIDGLPECIGIIYFDGSIGYIRDQNLKEIEMQELSVPVVEDRDLVYYSSQKGGWFYNDEKSLYFYDVEEEKEYVIYRSVTEERERNGSYNWEYKIKYFKLYGNCIYMFEELTAMLNAGRLVIYNVEKNEFEIFERGLAAFDISDDGKRLVYSSILYTGIAYQWDISEYNLETNEIISNYKSTSINRYIFYKTDSYEIYTVTNDKSEKPFNMRRVIKDTFLAFKVGELQWNEELLQIK